METPYTLAERVPHPELFTAPYFSPSLYPHIDFYFFFRSFRMDDNLATTENIRQNIDNLFRVLVWSSGVYEEHSKFSLMYIKAWSIQITYVCSEAEVGYHCDGSRLGFCLVCGGRLFMRCTQTWIC